MSFHDDAERNWFSGEATEPRIPAFHILFDMTKISSFNISVRNYLLLPIQAIFAFAVLIGAIVLVWIVLAWQNRRNPRRFRPLVGKLGIFVLFPVVLVSTIALLVPQDYLTQGRFGTVVRHASSEVLD